MRGRGRPTKLDDLVAHRIIAALEMGHSYGGAARRGGIEEQTLLDWRKRGAAGDPEYSAFSRRVEEACAKAEHRCIEVLKKALECPDLKLATDTAWKWLARRRPAEWAEVKPETKKAIEEGEATEADALDVARSIVAALESQQKAKTGT